MYVKWKYLSDKAIYGGGEFKFHKQQFETEQETCKNESSRVELGTSIL